MLRKVSADQIETALLVDVIRADAPEAIKQAMTMAIENIRRAVENVESLGFVLAEEVSDAQAMKDQEVKDLRAKVADLVMQKWKMASLAQRGAVRTANPELGLALDKLEASHVE